MSTSSVLDVLLPLIQLSRESQDRARPLCRDLSPKAWLKEYCTIRLAAPRGSGHTHAMVVMATAYPTDKMLLVTNRDFFLPDLHRRTAEARMSAVVSCEHCNWLDSVKGRDFQFVIFDTAGQTPKSKLEAMYDLLASRVSSGVEFFFIVLG